MRFGHVRLVRSLQRTRHALNYLHLALFWGLNCPSLFYKQYTALNSKSFPPCKRGIATEWQGVFPLRKSLQKEDRIMIENSAMYKISYGLFMLTTTDGEKQNGCIVNTVSMLTDNPKRIVVFVNKANYSEELLRKTGIFNVSVLTESAPFELFKQFGFVSGRDKDKFEGGMYETSENGLYYLPKHANAVLSGKVVDYYDYGTHTLFVAEVTEAKVLNDEKSVTYEYYQANIKQKPKVEAAPAQGEKWVCKICGYVHEGELPDDFICPWCKHPASDFEKMA